jgi:hypothetical protein
MRYHRGMPHHHAIDDTPTGRNTSAPADQTEFAFGLSVTSAGSASPEGENSAPLSTSPVQESSRANPAPELRTPATPSTGSNHAPSVAHVRKAAAPASLKRFRQTHKRVEIYLSLDDWWLVRARAREVGRKVPEVIRMMLVEWAKNAVSANCPKDQSHECPPRF